MADKRKTYVSVSVKRGVYGKYGRRIPFVEFLRKLKELAGEDKYDCHLMYGAYLDVDEDYERLEVEGMKMGVVCIDCDNEGRDRDIIEKFKKDMEKYVYVLWETYSSTSEVPKFRALIPLDADISYDAGVKKGIVRIWRDYADKAATWFFTPDRRHLEGIVFHKGEMLFPSAKIIEAKKKVEEEIEKERLKDVFAMQLEILKKGYILSGEGHFDMENGWRRLPSVKECLEFGVRKGERDMKLNAACYAMFKQGYDLKRDEFLREVYIEGYDAESLRSKFRRKRYR